MSYLNFIVGPDDRSGSETYAISAGQKQIKQEFKAVGPAREEMEEITIFVVLIIFLLLLGLFFIGLHYKRNSSINNLTLSNDV